MNRRALVAGIAAFLVAPRAALGARIHGWSWAPGKSVVVENKMGDAWNDHVAAAVAAYRAVLPDVRLRVEHRPGPCRYRRGGIVICERDIEWPRVAQASTYCLGFDAKDAVIEIDPDWAGYPDGVILCHELGHVFGLDHNTDRNSCMAGYGLTAPGSYDVESLALVYRNRAKRLRLRRRRQKARKRASTRSKRGNKR